MFSEDRVSFTTRGNTTIRVILRTSPQFQIRQGLRTSWGGWSSAATSLVHVLYFPMAPLQVREFVAKGKLDVCSQCLKEPRGRGKEALLVKRSLVDRKSLPPVLELGARHEGNPQDEVATAWPVLLPQDSLVQRRGALRRGGISPTQDMGTAPIEHTRMAPSTFGPSLFLPSLLGTLNLFQMSLSPAHLPSSLEPLLQWNPWVVRVSTRRTKSVHRWKSGDVKKEMP
jgi:hypothetical protein